MPRLFISLIVAGQILLAPQVFAQQEQSRARRILAATRTIAKHTVINSLIGGGVGVISGLYYIGGLQHGQAEMLQKLYDNNHILRLNTARTQGTFGTAIRPFVRNGSDKVEFWSYEFGHNTPLSPEDFILEDRGETGYLDFNGLNRLFRFMNITMMGSIVGGTYGFLKGAWKAARGN